MTTYKIRPATIEATIEAIRMPQVRDQEAVRQVAIWLYEQGYRDGVSPGDLSEEYVYNGEALADHGTNFLTLADEDGDEFTASLGDYIIWDDGEVTVLSASAFENTYEEN